MGKTLLLFAITISTVVAAADPFVGTWKPAVDQWKLSAGAPEWRKQQSHTFEMTGKDTYRVTINPGPDGADARTGEWKVDGKEHRDEAGVANSSKIERVSERQLRMTVSGPKGKSVSDWIVSNDGKTLTVMRKGTGSTSGRALDERLFYRKQ